MEKKISTIILILINIFLFSCVSLPEWVGKLPNNPEYYYGLGHSYTANQSNDYRQAMAKARIDLAQSISSLIKSQTDIYSSLEGGRLIENYTQNLSQEVFSKLESIEILDSFHHRKKGYWIVLRLEKAEWEKLKEYETNKLKSEVELKLSNTTNTFSDKLANYFIIKDMLDASPFSYYIKLNEENSEYYANSYIENKITNTISKFKYKITNPEFAYITESFNSNLDLQADKTFLNIANIGQVVIKVKDRANNLVSTGQSDTNGKAIMKIPAGFLKIGSNQLKYEFYLKTNNKEYVFQSTTKNIDIKKTPVNFYIKTNQNIDFNLIKNRFESIDGFPFVLNLINNQNSISSDYNMHIGFNFHMLPQSYFGAPFYAKAQVDVQLFLNNQAIFSYTKTGIQDGGSNASTAIYKTTETALNTIIRDRVFITKLYKDLNIRN